MRVAICISGHLRSYKDSFPYYRERLYDGLANFCNEIDVFISTWDKIDSRRTWGNISDKSFFGEENIDLDFLRNHYQYKSLCILNEKNSKFLFSKEGKEKFFFILPMTYHWYMANQLKKKHEKVHGFKYDLVIKYRADSYPEKKISSKIAEGKTLKHCGNPSYDLFFASDSETMDNVCDNFYFRLKDRVGLREAEVLLTEYLAAENIGKQNIHTKFTLMREQ